MDGISKDGRKWKIDYATKVCIKSILGLRSVESRALTAVLYQSKLDTPFCTTWHFGSQECVVIVQADFKFFGWKIPDDVESVSRSPTPRSPVRSEYSD